MSKETSSWIITSHIKQIFRDFTVALIVISDFNYIDTDAEMSCILFDFTVNGIEDIEPSPGFIER